MDYAGLLESIARIEQEGYDMLKVLGASPVQRVMTAGGGSSNDVWTRIRSRRLGVDVSASPQGAQCLPVCSLRCLGMAFLLGMTSRPGMEPRGAFKPCKVRTPLSLHAGEACYGAAILARRGAA